MPRRRKSEPKRYAVMWSQALGGMPADALRAAHIQAWRVRYLEDHAPASCNRALGLLGRVYTLAVRDEVVDRNPVRSAGRVQEPPGRVRWLSEEEEDRLRAVMRPQDWRLVVLAMHTGMRQEEQFRLLRVHVHLSRGVAMVPRSKSNKARPVALNSVAREVLAEALSEHDLPWVFPGPLRRGPLDAHNWTSRIWRPALAAAGIEDFRWHDLRHTFASRLASQDVPTRVIQELLGHSSPAMTAKYAHLAPSHLRAAVSILEEGTGTETGTREKFNTEPAPGGNEETQPWRGSFVVGEDGLEPPTPCL
jgi:integrase